MAPEYEEAQFEDEDTAAVAVAPTEPPRTPAGLVRRDTVGSTELSFQTETASTAAAALARANVEIRYALAMKSPRDWGDVRALLLKECARPGFAQVARYAKPVGGNKIEGPSIRFAEAALRCMGNVLPEDTIVYDDAAKRIIRVSVTDLERNLTFSKEFIVEKTVERKRLKTGQKALSSRINSYGDTVYIVEATEDDLGNKIGSQLSKAMRNIVLRILPGDITDECMAKVVSIQTAGVMADPDGARKALMDAYFAIGVKPSDLAAYLGHPLDGASPAEIVDLRAVYAAIRDGEATWAKAMESRAPEAKPEESKGFKETIARKAEAIKAKAKPNGGKPDQKPAGREPGDDS